MRCKPCLAVMVKKSTCGNEGRVGVVSYWVSKGDTCPSGRPSTIDGWVVNGQFRARNQVGEIHERDWGLSPDDWLIPLPGGEGQDQTLAWAGRPALLEQVTRVDV